MKDITIITDIFDRQMSLLKYSCLKSPMIPNCLDKFPKILKYLLLQHLFSYSTESSSFLTSIPPLLFFSFTFSIFYLNACNSCAWCTQYLRLKRERMRRRVRRGVSMRQRSIGKSSSSKLIMDQLLFCDYSLD